MSEIQVDKEHYSFEQYMNDARWSSYYEQIRYAVSEEVHDVLAIGVGDGIVPKLISIIHPTVNVTTFDFDQQLIPDICGDIRMLSTYVSDRYDVIICCQVLEHIPYNQFESCLTEMKKCLKPSGRLILSLPNNGLRFRLYLEIKGRKQLITADIHGGVCKFYKKEFDYNGQHYWEIDAARKYRKTTVRKVISSHFAILEEYCVRNNSYHRFYICAPKQELSRTDM